MLNLSDNELDDLSREAAEKFEPAENAQSWNKLQQLLDTNLGTPKPIPKTIRPGTLFMYSGAILIAASLTYFLTKTKKNNQNSTQQVSRITDQKSSAKVDKKNEAANTVVLNDKNGAQKKENDKIPDQKSSADNNSTSASSNKDRSQETADNDKKIDQSGSAKNNLTVDSRSIAINNKLEKRKSKIASDKEQETRNKIQGTNDITERSGNNNKEENTNRTKENTSEKDFAKNSLKEKNKKNNFDADRSLNENSSSEKDLVQNNTKQKDLLSSVNKHHGRNTIADEKNKSNDGINSNENASGSNSSTTEVQNDELKFAAIPGLEPVTELYFLISDSALRSFKSTNKLTAIVNPGRHRTYGAFINRSLQIGILFAPEFSEVKHIYQNNRIGNNLGITLSYQLFNKISINSGIIFSKKYYQSDEKNFHAPKDAVGNGVDIKFVDASANVIDIPLNLRYNYFSDENSTFFINAGFSSYLMSKQNLNLFCQPNSYNALRYSGAWVQPNGNIEAMNKNYLFSIFNLSAGFETSMGNNFSFQFEPYVKLPVKGIGYGKVDLSSYGINFSLKYAPVLKRGRRL